MMYLMFSLNGKIWLKHKLGRRSSISKHIMVVSFTMIGFWNYVKMRVLYVTLLLEIHHNIWGGRTHESDIDGESSMYVVQC